MEEILVDIGSMNHQYTSRLQLLDMSFLISET